MCLSKILASFIEGPLSDYFLFYFCISESIWCYRQSESPKASLKVSLGLEMTKEGQQAPGIFLPIAEITMVRYYVKVTWILRLDSGTHASKTSNGYTEPSPQTLIPRILAFWFLLCYYHIDCI